MEPILSPGQILEEDFMDINGMSIEDLALFTDIPIAKLKKIIYDGAPMPKDLMQAVARFFHTNIEYWEKLQAAYNESKGVVI